MTQRNHPIDDDLLKQRLKSTVDGYLTLTAPFGEAPPAFMILALSCISYAPAKRPTASEAVRRLEEQLNEMAEKEANVTPVSTARPVVAIDLAITKASGLSSTSATLYCTVALDDVNRTALDTTPAKSEGGVYSWPTPLTFSDVKPLESMLDLTLMSKGMFSDSKVGKASMRLEDLLSVDDDDATETPSLDAPRTATVDLFSSGERKGSLEVSVTFSTDLRAYLALYVEEKTKLISFYAGKNANHNSDYQRKRDMAAVLLATAHP
ncbi:hypothetical protein SPRG_19682 [Saprolegnia parasitica CBS 223.65]|uniref:Uncharacterized protein n=1 Tax=Saprolegnia parasitica (strain CBS 223.65) TaxID=695850 RepID=A0A067CK65_SAPPC|nr:hypothetical protein SPRG_19682 [Saprolegnia parasitica CBS 223.65]KDO30908.1 hypothetical protein SPRG_19682 [Saprolegnia parasitica CBS 223.65]|eukprot:XP_012198632.1 hypothetical protein SPRG_19682 [Saprolegnia parasitica CBS 223.65]